MQSGIEHNKNTLRYTLVLVTNVAVVFVPASVVFFSVNPNLCCKMLSYVISFVLVCLGVMVGGMTTQNCKCKHIFIFVKQLLLI